MERTNTMYEIIGEEEFRRFEASLKESGLYLKEVKKEKCVDAEKTDYFVLRNKACKRNEPVRRLQGFIHLTDYGPAKSPRDLFTGHFYRVIAKYQTKLEDLAEEFFRGNQ